MKIEKIDSGEYCLIKTRNHLIFDKDIATYLDLTLEEYHNILINNGAHICEEEDEYYFKNESDIEKAIKILDPYEILAKLTRC